MEPLSSLRMPCFLILFLSLYLGNLCGIDAKRTVQEAAVGNLLSDDEELSLKGQGVTRTKTRSSTGSSASGMCHNYCLRCNDGSTVWMHRWKNPWNLALAPISIPLSLFTVTEPLAPSVFTCQKMSLSKFDKNPDKDGNKCQRNQFAKAGWLWRKQSKDDLRRKFNYYEGGDTTKLRPFEETMQDQISYNLGCALLMDRNVENAWQQYKSFGAYSTVGQAAWVCAGHTSLCGMGGVAGYIDAKDSDTCQAACNSDTVEPGQRDPQEVFPKEFLTQVKKHVMKYYLTGKQVYAEVHPDMINATTGLPEKDFSLSPFAEIGAKVGATTNKWREMGIVKGSVVMKLNGEDMLQKDFSEVADAVASARKNKGTDPLKFWFSPPRVCSQTTMDDILRYHELVEDKNKRHLYVACWIVAEEDDFELTVDMKNKKKVSCDPRECDGDDWCFVKNGCAGDACRKIEDPSPCTNGGLKRLGAAELLGPGTGNAKEDPINEEYGIPQSRVDECTKIAKCSSFDGKTLDQVSFDNCIRGW